MELLSLLNNIPAPPATDRPSGETTAPVDGAESPFASLFGSLLPSETVVEHSPENETRSAESPSADVKENSDSQDAPNITRGAEDSEPIPDRTQTEGKPSKNIELDLPKADSSEQLTGRRNEVPSSVTVSENAKPASETPISEHVDPSGQAENAATEEDGSSVKSESLPKVEAEEKSGQTDKPARQSSPDRAVEPGKEHTILKATSSQALSETPESTSPSLVTELPDATVSPGKTEEAASAKNAMSSAANTVLDAENVDVGRTVAEVPDPVVNPDKNEGAASTKNATSPAPNARQDSENGDFSVIEIKQAVDTTGEALQEASTDADEIQTESGRSESVAVNLEEGDNEGAEIDSSDSLFGTSDEESDAGSESFTEHSDSDHPAKEGKIEDVESAHQEASTPSDGNSGIDEPNEQPFIEVDATAETPPDDGVNGQESVTLEETVETTERDFSATRETSSSRPDAARLSTAPRSRGSLPLAWLQASIDRLQGSLNNPGGWASVKLNLDDGDGTVVVKARKDQSGVSVTVGFSDPQLRSLAAEQAEQLRASLEAKYDTDVNFTLLNDESSDQTRQGFLGQDKQQPAFQASSPMNHHSFNTDAAIGAPLKGARHVWIG